jgi:hypothetical protein
MKRRPPPVMGTRRMRQAGEGQARCLDPDAGATTPMAQDLEHALEVERAVTANSERDGRLGTGARREPVHAWIRVTASGTTQAQHVSQPRGIPVPRKIRAAHVS